MPALQWLTFHWSETSSTCSDRLCLETATWLDIEPLAVVDYYGEDRESNEAKSLQGRKARRALRTCDPIADLKLQGLSPNLGQEGPSQSDLV